MLQWSPVDEGVDGVGLHCCVDGARYCVCYNHRVAMSESCTKCINVEVHNIKQFRPGLVYTYTIYFTSILYTQLEKTCHRPNLILNHIPVIAHLGGFNSFKLLEIKFAERARFLAENKLKHHFELNVK